MSHSIRLAALVLCVILGFPATEGMAQTSIDSEAVKPFRIFAVVWRGRPRSSKGSATTSPSAASRSR